MLLRWLALTPSFFCITQILLFIFARLTNYESRRKKKKDDVSACEGHNSVFTAPLYTRFFLRLFFAQTLGGILYLYLSK